MVKGAWQHVFVFVLLISTNKCRKSHSSYLVLVNWKLPSVVFCVYYILIPICPCFCWFIVLQHACKWSMTEFLKKLLNILIHASPNASKIKFDWHCVIWQGIKKYIKKHAKNLRDLLWNLWAVSNLVNLPNKTKIRPGRQECKTLHILWQGRG